MLGMFLSTVYLLAEEAVRSDGIDTFYCGMQMGMDVWAGQQILRLKKIHPEIKLICVSPFTDEIKRRTGKDLEDYVALRDSCDSFIGLKKEYSRGCYLQRNRYMVDRSDSVIAALSDFKSSGGTVYTVNYAKRLGKRVRIIDLNAFASDHGFPKL